MTASRKLELGVVLLLATLLRQPALLGLEPMRYWFDEKFILENAVRAGLEGELKPIHVYYPALAHYPTALGFFMVDAANDVLRSRGLGSGYGVADEPGAAGRRIFVARVVHGLLGALTVLATWLAGRWLWGEGAGLWAALFLALSPAHLHTSLEIKPQAALTLCATLSLLVAIRVLAAPRWGWVLLGGAMIGSAVACNYNSVTAAIPLAAALALAGGSRLRAALQLAVGGAVSFATFVLWNPWFARIPEWYLATLRGFSKGYAAKEATRGLAPLELAQVVAERVFTRWLPGVAGLAFYAGLAWVLIEIGRGLAGKPGFRGVARSHLLVLPYILVHVGFTMKMTSLFLPQHYAPIVPFLALIAGHAIATLLAWARTLPDAHEHRVAGTAAVALFLALLAPGPWVFYRTHAIRTSTERAIATLDARSMGKQPILSLGLDLPPRLPALALDRAVRIPPALLERSSFLLAPSPSARARLQHAPTDERLAFAGLWFDPRIEPVAHFRARWPDTLGPDLRLLRATSSGVVQIEQRAVPFGNLRIEGHGANENDLFWLRGKGARASAVSPVSAAPGELVEVELSAAADDSGLEPGGRLMLAIVVDGHVRVVEVARNELRPYHSATVPVAGGRLLLELRYVGGDGGRVYMTRLEVRRLIAARSLTAAVVARRADDIVQLRRAGLGL